MRPTDVVRSVRDGLSDYRRGVESAAEHLRELLSRTARSEGPGHERGAGALEALREKVGEASLFRIMRGWLQQHRYANATVGHIVRYAQRIARRDLSTFFYVWLYRPGKTTVV